MRGYEANWILRIKGIERISGILIKKADYINKISKDKMFLEIYCFWRTEGLEVWVLCLNEQKEVGVDSVCIYHNG